MQKATEISRLFLIGLVICLRAIAELPGSQNPFPSGKLEEFRLIDKLCNATLTWLSTGNEADGVACDKLAESLLALDQAAPRSYFLSAQVAWLRNQPDVAIARLNKLIDQRGEEISPIVAHLPIKVVGRLWIATIARYTGSMESARDAYLAILAMLSGDRPMEGISHKSGLMTLCCLYLAEVESDHFGDKGKALSYLRASQAVKIDADSADAGLRIYRNWAQYEGTRLTSGKAEANRQLPGEHAMMSMPLLVANHLALVGLTTEPLSDSCRPSARRELIAEAVRKRVIDSGVSRTDRMLGRFLMAYHSEMIENLLEAEKRYSELFEDDLFVSPAAGMRAADIKRSGGKVAEAKEILGRLSARYPRFESLLRKPQKDPGEDGPE